MGVITIVLLFLFPADLKLDFGRPMWIHIDLDLLKRLICFSENLLPRQKSQTGNPSELGNGVRSMALSTNYVAVTLIAGDSHDATPFVKSSFSSLNLGVSLKIQDEGNTLRITKISNFKVTVDL